MVELRAPTRAGVTAGRMLGRPTPDPQTAPDLPPSPSSSSRQISNVLNALDIDFHPDARAVRFEFSLAILASSMDCPLEPCQGAGVLRPQDPSRLSHLPLDLPGGDEPAGAMCTGVPEPLALQPPQLLEDIGVCRAARRRGQGEGEREVKVKGHYDGRGASGCPRVRIRWLVQVLGVST